LKIENTNEPMWVYPANYQGDQRNIQVEIINSDNKTVYHTMAEGGNTILRASDSDNIQFFTSHKNTQTETVHATGRAYVEILNCTNSIATMANSLNPTVARHLYETYGGSSFELLGVNIALYKRGDPTDLQPGSAIVTDPTGLIQIGYSTEEDVRSTGGKLTITLSDAIWNPNIDTDPDLVQAILDGVHGNLATSTSWNALLTETLIYTVRVSDSVLTIEISPWANFDIATTETVTTTIPASCTNAGAILYPGAFYISAIQAAAATEGLIFSSEASELRYSSEAEQLLFKE
jgi:hypothetical protein